VAKRPTRKAKEPEAPSLHEYVEHAADRILEHKFTIVVALSLVVVALVFLGVRRREAAGGEARAWELFSLSQDPAALRLVLSEVEGSTAYPWAVRQVAGNLYRQGKFGEARRLLEPLVDQPDVGPRARGYCLYTLGCVCLEEGQVAQARKHLEKALTYAEESPFLRERVSGTLTALEDWPLAAWSAEGGEGTPEEASAAGSTTGPSEEPVPGSERPEETAGPETTP